MANIERMRENLEAIRKFPDQHYQSAWVRAGNDHAASLDALKADNGDHPPCGTTLCFAGWDTFLHAPKGSRIVAGEWLVLPGMDESVQIGTWTTAGMDLTEAQASAFFYRAENLADLEVLTNAIEANPEATYQELVQIALDAARERNDEDSIAAFFYAVELEKSYYDD